MNTITSIHLNGKAYHVEEAGYQALRRYLDDASENLRDNPDKQEILTDLEQAIAEKANNFLRPQKDILTTREIEEIIEEMGPVNQSALGDDAESTKQSAKTQYPSGKRFYLIREGSMISGVCTGLAAYFNIDVILPRLAFVGLTLVTSGVWILIYMVLAYITPYANTPEERAAAYGRPFSAQDVINRAKETYTRFTEEARRQRGKEGVLWFLVVGLFAFFLIMAFKSLFG